ncbi:MAG: hypothetical protein FJY76_01290 [Candidatus Aenigmarchaeota archaeon]|nr:hypothetical protein [Candidatus Aenigmarchaeota archaeon]
MASDRRMVRALLASTHIVLGFVEDSVLGVTYRLNGIEYIACGSSVRDGERVLLRHLHEGTEHLYPFPMQRTGLEIEPVTD